MSEKICCKCKNIKEPNCFSKNKSTKDGLAKQCKECISIANKIEYKQKISRRSKEYYLSNKENIKLYKNEYYLKNKESLIQISKKYYEDNKENVSSRAKEYRLQNKEMIKKYAEKYRLENKDKIKEYRKEYVSQNKEKIKKYQSEYGEAHKEKLKKFYKIYYTNNKEEIFNRQKEYLRNNNNARIKSNIRTRLSMILRSKGIKKSVSTMKLLDCSIEFFIEYIEKKFTKNMNWENYGKYGWHIDHIKPCSSFNLENEEEQKKCFHYTNLQPLWATTEIAIKNGESSDYVGNLEKHNRF